MGGSAQLGTAGRHLAETVTRLRDERGMDQRTLAARVTACGRRMTASAVSRIENLDRRVDVDDLLALAAALEVPRAELLPHDASADTDDAGEQPPGPGPVEGACRQEIEGLGDLEELAEDGFARTLAAVALRLAGAVDHGGGEGGRALPPLARELREVLAELRALESEEPADDDEFGDLAAPG